MNKTNLELNTFQSEMKKLGHFNKKYSKKDDTIINISNLSEGFNDSGDYIIKKSNDSIDYVIDKICDHNGGRLILKGDQAVCPNHNWKLNLNSLKYQESFIKKSPVECQVEKNNLYLENKSFFLENTFLKKTNKKVYIRWINHACVHISNGSVSLITDPWILGPAFLTGWWLDSPSPKDSIDLMNSSDYVLISHNHPDHLHAETLNKLSKNHKIIVPNFKSKSTEVFLEKLGFNNLVILDFMEIFEMEDNVQISILKSGDFRDDSGFYLNIDGNEILLCVDSNYLNSYQLPRNIDLLCTSFASGASGYPLIYDNHSQGNKSRVLFRNRKSAQKSVSKYIEITNPKFYLPYAGMFKEKAPRDEYIFENNKKNSFEEISKLISNKQTRFIIPKKNKVLCLQNGTITMKEAPSFDLMDEDDIDNYINSYKKDFQLDFDVLIKYFKTSGYREKQILQIIPTDDNFNPIGEKALYINFYEQKYFSFPIGEILNEEISEFNNMILKVRSESLMCLVLNYLPWEDLSIGFQCRINRFPDIYESKFWYFFTNVYVNKENIRYSSYCGSCSIIDQNKIWL